MKTFHLHRKIATFDIEPKLASPQQISPTPFHSRRDLAVLGALPSDLTLVSVQPHVAENVSLTTFEIPDLQNLESMHFLYCFCSINKEILSGVIERRCKCESLQCFELRFSEPIKERSCIESI